MNYRIEYLRESTDENSVCFAKDAAFPTLDEAETIAQIGAQEVQTQFGANGFQIRDSAGRVVLIETFDLPTTHPQ